MFESDDNGRVLLTSRCKILAAITLIVVIAEIVSVYRWETGFYKSETGFLEASEVLRPGRFGRNGGNAISPIRNSTGPAVQTSAAPMASDTDLVTRLPGGRVRLSKKSEEELARRLKAATDKKVILVWVPMFGAKPQVNVDAEQCGNCEVTYDRGRIDDGNIGAVVFHFDALRANNMPKTRNLKHLYIFWDLESTATLRVVRGHSLKFEDSFKFNSTMTYRRDSDLYQSYEHLMTVESIAENNKLSLQDLLKLKTKLAIGIVSNCGYTPGAKIRIKMMRELDRLKFGFEGFGGCFGRRFPGGKNDEFHQGIRKYKFYLSFENSKHCKDYITEKLFSNAVSSLAVPVVWGAKKEDYEAVMPPGSFIFAEDFSSMKALSEYLTYLDKNDTAYLEYFKWLTMKPSELPQYGRARSWCHICRALHGINTDDIYNPKFDENNLKRPLFTDGVAARTVEHLIDWYYGEDNPECFSR